MTYHTPRHDAAVHEWASAAMMTFGSDNVLVDPDHSQRNTGIEFRYTVSTFDT